MSTDGSNQTLLAVSAFNALPAWSPDGTKIAFESFRDGNYEIYVMDAGGSNQTRLTNNPAVDQFPAWQRTPVTPTPTPMPTPDPCGTDVSSQVQVIRSGYHYIYPSSYEFSQTLTLINRGARLRSPLYLVLDGLPTNSEFLLGSQLITHCGSRNGSYLIPLSFFGDGLDPGGRVGVPLVFVTQRLNQPRYSTRVLSGLVSR